MIFRRFLSNILSVQRGFGAKGCWHRPTLHETWITRRRARVVMESDLGKRGNGETINWSWMKVDVASLTTSAEWLFVIYILERDAWIPSFSRVMNMQMMVRGFFRSHLFWQNLNAFEGIHVLNLHVFTAWTFSTLMPVACMVEFNVQGLTRPCMEASKKVSSRARQFRVLHCLNGVKLV